MRLEPGTIAWRYDGQPVRIDRIANGIVYWSKNATKWHERKQGLRWRGQTMLSLVRRYFRPAGPAND